MNRTPASAKRVFVWLDKPPLEDQLAGKSLDPDHAYVAIDPAPPGPYDENKITHIVRMDFHPDLTLNTRLTLDCDGRQLWVRGIQDMDFRHIELTLLCEEVLTP